MNRDSATPNTLNEECITFSKYLVHHSPDTYVLEKYREAHRTNETLRNLKPNRFEDLLLRLARFNSVGARLVDSYTALFFRGAAVRKKMVLALAVLESCAPTYPIFDSPERGGVLIFVLRMLFQGVIFFLSLLTAIVLLMPIHLAVAAGHVLRLRPPAVRTFGEPSDFLLTVRAQAHERAGTGDLPRESPPVN